VTTPVSAEPADAAPRRSRRGLVLAIVAGLVLVAIAVVLGTVIFGGSEDGRYSFGSVDVSRGAAEIKTAGETSYKKLDQGTKIAAGDAIRTAPSATTTVVLTNGSVLRIGPGSGVAFEQRKGSSTHPVIRVASGAAYFRSTPNGDAAPIEITADRTSVTGSPTISAITCTASGCTVTAVEGTLHVKPTSGRAANLAGGTAAALSDRAIDEIAIAGPSAWILENRNTDRADRLPSVAKGAGGGTLDQARIDGDWRIAGTVRSSTAPNFDIGEPVSFAISLKSKCPTGPCDVTTTMGRYSGTGTRSAHDLTFTAAGTVQCVNKLTRAVTNPNLGPEALKVVAHVSKAVLTKDGPVATELSGKATYDADIGTSCNNGPTGKQHAAMDVTVSGPPVPSD
jgi:ferric-dicitrate binding protein FerR (iron transport regulator)